MECVFVRHGEASWQATSDAERCLTPLGQAHARAAAHWLATNWLPERVLVSPYRRAQQTADAFTAHLAGVPRDTHSALTPDTPLEHFERAIEQAACDRLLLIAHNPLLSHCLTWFCGDDVREAMAPASMALVEFPVVGRDMGRLRWLRHAPNYDQIASCQ